MGETLAIEGGAPVRDTFLPFAKPFIGEEEIQEVVDTLRSGWLTTGPKVHRFERDFGDFVGAPHAVAVSSATAALHLSLEAIGLKSGDEVITTPFTFTASAEVIIYFGAKPVLVDIDEETFNIDVNKVREAITPKTKAILPVHIAGQPCDMDALCEIAKEYELYLIEDAAHALPARYKGRLIGTFGDLTAFSFYATKTITTGEGGMITTSNEELAERCRMMALHGISKGAWNRYAESGSWYYEVLASGFKYNMSDIHASLGIQQLKRCETLYQSRREIAGRYSDRFKGLPELTTPVVKQDVQHAWHLYILKLRLEKLNIDRGRFIEALKAENIGASVHFIPLHKHPFYRDKYGMTDDDFPVASRVYPQILSLPIYPSMSLTDTDDVIASVMKVIERTRVS